MIDAPPGAVPGTDAGRRRVAFVLVSVAVFLVVAGLSLLAPALATLARERGLSSAQAGTVLSAFAFGRLLFSIPSGMLADRLGFGGSATIGCVLAVGGAIAATAMPSYGGLLAAQVVQGIGSAIHNTAALAYIIGAMPDDRVGASLATHQGIVLLGVSFSPVIGGAAVTTWGPDGPFWAYAATGALSLVLSVAAVVIGPDLVRRVAPPTVCMASAAGPTTPIRRLMMNRSFAVSLLTAFGLFWMVAGVRNTLIPLFAERELGFDPFQVGLLLGAAAVANGIALFGAGRATDRVGRRPVLIGGTAALVVVLLGISTAGGLTLWLWTVALGVGKGYAGAAPPAILADVADPAVRGLAVGIQRTATGLGLLVGPLTVGLLLDALTARTTFRIAAAVLALAAVAALFTPETLPRRARNPPGAGGTA